MSYRWYSYSSKGLNSSATFYFSHLLRRLLDRPENNKLLTLKLFWRIDSSHERSKLAFKSISLLWGFGKAGLRGDRTVPKRREKQIDLAFQGTLMPRLVLTDRFVGRLGRKDAPLLRSCGNPTRRLLRLNVEKMKCRFQAVGVFSCIPFFF